MGLVNAAGRKAGIPLCLTADAFAPTIATSFTGVCIVGFTFDSRSLSGPRGYIRMAISIVD